MTNQPTQEPLPDLPLIREELLTEIEQRHHDRASAAELAEIRRHYRDLVERCQ